MTARHMTECIIFTDTYQYLLKTKMIIKKCSGRMAVDLPHREAILIV